jgi:hypothetical protein
MDLTQGPDSLTRQDILVSAERWLLQIKVHL